MTFEEVEGLIDVLRRTREAEVACVLKEAARRHLARQPPFARERSTCERSPSAQGGGGHRFAAGFTSDDPADVVIAKILAAL